MEMKEMKGCWCGCVRLRPERECGGVLLDEDEGRRVFFFECFMGKTIISYVTI